ncbi:MAG TPA: hypothetical protein VGQ46_18150 [Thermoanaerobaculia bacterium]|jgi:hypothetical protein|nr:hypothetical protein [Thermoanaerobaculia bacterium]
MREVLCIIAGAIIILATSVDLVWTTLGTHGGGPVSDTLLRGIWKLLLRLHRRRPKHRALSYAGSAMLALIVVIWMGLFWAGSFLLFEGRRDSVVESHSRRIATNEEKFFFTGATLFTFGTAEYAPNGGFWQLATVLTGAIGLGSVTLSITFLLQVLQSVVTKRSVAVYISDVGSTPYEILNRSWTGERFNGLDGHMATITEQLHLVTEQHLAYPVLRYFHSEKLRTASTVRLAGLYEVTLILECGIAPHLRLGRISIYPLRDALAGYCESLSGMFVSPAGAPPPLPSLRPVRDLGVETVDDATFAAAAGEEHARLIRRFFLGLLHEDGWTWDDVWKS